MNYEQAVNYIHSLLKFGIKPGLERVSVLLELMDNPQNKLKYVHVAGTNGKGSTCNMISNALINAGYDVGLFTSPYVVDFCERFQFNGKMISQNELTDEIETVEPLVTKLEKDGIELTEFEVITAVAFHWFYKKGCDIVVLEVGLGGRFDSTNVIKNPLISAITSISFDHTNILGNSIEEIAGEKAGIIKENSVCVTYPNQNPKALKVVRDVCKEKNTGLVIPNTPKILSSTIDGNVFIYNHIEFKTRLIGEHQVYNAVTAIEVLKELRFLGYDISLENIFNGIYNTTVPARMEIAKNKNTILIDGGHNEECSEALKNVLEKYLSDKEIICIIGMMADKDVKSYISNVIPFCKKVYTITPDNPRSMLADDLANLVKPICSDVKTINFGQAKQILKDKYSKNSIILVCGSFYLASDIRSYII